MWRSNETEGSVKNGHFLCGLPNPHVHTGEETQRQTDVRQTKTVVGKITKEARKSQELVRESNKDSRENGRGLTRQGGAGNKRQVEIRNYLKVKTPRGNQT